MANKILLLVIIVIGYLSFFTSCANIGMPSGGLKDSIAPVIVRSIPAYGQRNFTDQKIRMTFNEFVIVEGLNDKFVVSPPTTKRPIIRTKGKTLIIDLNEKLKANTTYSLDFKDGVSDNNERNALRNLRLAFSTGPDFDSLRVVGFIKDAFNLEPIANSYVLLYRGRSDTLVYKTRPDFIAKTDQKGFFAVTNLPADTFQVYGLSDVDNNLKFTPGSDSISFIDNLVIPSAKFFPERDTTISGNDTLLVFGKTRFSPEPLYLLRFGEPFFDLRLDKYVHPTRKVVDLTFTQSVADTFSIEPVNFEAKPGWKFTEMSSKSDSVRIWLTDSMVYNKDTLIFKVDYLQQDSLKEYYTKSDTIRLYFTDVTQSSRNKRKERRRIDKEENSVMLTTNAKAGFDIYRQLLIESPEPISVFDSTKISLFEKIDTLFTPIKYKLTPDSLNKRRYHLAHPWKYGTDYKLTIDSAAVKTIYSTDSKKIKEEFKTQEEEYYGKIILDLKNITVPTIVELLTDEKDEKIVQSVSVTKSGPVTFQYLEPRKYLIKTIFDRNNNGKWDTGDLKKRIQPEEVMYYLEVVKVRGNWEAKKDWSLPSQQFSKTIIDEELEAQKIKDKLKKKKKTTAF
ncbi:MAG: Ig-like domain-containing protein [Mariniphaga sp.]|nr:Ig-like domain-containing protein [Mariniphaga sp.]